MEFYKRLDENLDDEKPPEDYIKYDYLLDDWLERKAEKRRRENKKPHKRSYKNVVNFD